MNRNKKRWILLAGVAVVICAAALLAVQTGVVKSAAKAEQKKQEPPPLAFAATDVVRLAPHRLSVELAMPGTLQAFNQATVRSKLSAEVRRLPVREGDRVAAGQVIAEFDTAQLRNQLAERQASLEAARATLAQTERTRASNAQLVKQSFISKNAFDTADDAFRAQAAAVQAAEAQLAQTQLLLSDAVVRAPIAGQVAKRFVQPGEKVAFDAPLLHIVDLGTLEVQAQAPVADVARIAPGAEVAVEIEGLADRPYRGRIDRINPTTEAGSRMIAVYVLLANDDGRLRGGMFARVRMQVGGDAPVPALPVAAVQDDRGQSFVWIIADGKLSRRNVVTGVRDERAQRVEITSGLAGDEQVIGTRFDNLREGMLANIVSAEPKVAVRGSLALAR
ncbi:MAG: efflux RND transporter periplasmic adaptor subunit [Burkholderiales bacterium]|jgi:RND family efflux transporter MFP subunit|nr:efflux RND transporter periplasmic adaptor subunit [Burkholderiales bacterium]